MSYVLVCCNKTKQGGRFDLCVCGRHPNGDFVVPDGLDS
jgi:hypothetical protein